MKAMENRAPTAPPPKTYEGGDEVEWVTAPAPVAYPDAVAAMEDRVAAIRAGHAGERIWLLEHPPLYTAGTSARPADLLDPDRFPVFATGRGGQYTYHGPGQRVAYVMLDLKRRGCDLRAYVCDLEDWIIDTLSRFDIAGNRRAGRVGIWVALPGGAEAKIAAVGVRVRRWVSYHGVAINLNPDLSHFDGIVPCGIAEHGVTSMAALGRTADLTALDSALRQGFESIFGRSTRAAAA